MTIVYIHGASATAESFAYIRQFVRDHTELPDIALEYNSADGFQHNIEQMYSQLDDAESLFFISHSLGGIYALHLANRYADRTIGGVSLSTPYGGCRQADFAKYFLPFSKLMKDIGTMSGPMVEARRLPAPPNWTNIVTTRGGSPWIHEPNDGVVTIESMQHRTDFELVELYANHYEVVLSKQVVEIILDVLQNIKRPKIF
jgi:pimeloyl-ACP methyl ester carboxylesterase